MHLTIAPKAHISQKSSGYSGLICRHQPADIDFVKTTAEEIQYRRKFPRRGFKRSIGVLCGPRYKLCHGVEIGEGGMSFSGYSGYKVNALVVLNFQIPEGSFISVQAEIKNMDEDRETRLNTYGCAFINLSFEHKREIRSFVSARSSKE